MRSSHPIWKNITPAKRPLHHTRFFLAKQFTKFFPRDKFIGVTGSVGKTTTVMACTAVLSKRFSTISTSPDLDPIFNIPETLLQVRKSIKKVVLEMGIEYPGDMNFYLSLVRPKTAIITAINYAHSEFLGPVDEIAREKAKLLESLPASGLAIVNWDDLNSRKVAEKSPAEVMFYGTDAKNCHVWASNIRNINYQTSFELNYGVERVEVVSNFLGAHQVYPLLAAAALGLNEGVSLLQVKNALEKLTPPPHRLQPILGHNNSVILDDTYNSSPLAVEEALETLNQVPARRRIVVLGEMKELGPFSETLHRKIARKIYQEKPDLVLLGTGDVKYIAEELISLGFIPERLESGLQNPQITSKLLKILSKGDVSLIKGSRAVRLDEVVKKIAKSR